MEQFATPCSTHFVEGLFSGGLGGAVYGSALWTWKLTDGVVVLCTFLLWMLVDREYNVPALGAAVNSPFSQSLSCRLQIHRESQSAPLRHFHTHWHSRQDVELRFLR